MIINYGLNCSRSGGLGEDLLVQAVALPDVAQLLLLLQQDLVDVVLLQEQLQRFPENPAELGAALLPADFPHEARPDVSQFGREPLLQVPHEVLHQVVWPLDLEQGVDLRGVLLQIFDELLQNDGIYVPVSLSFLFRKILLILPRVAILLLLRLFFGFLGRFWFVKGENRQLDIIGL